ncbi:MAG: ATP-binding protein [Kofleriaceae bacterium]|nr:ATP-binding protein [Kofleriaceae bacterium]MCB9572511.1 ATP-binding protein [Kofleriaceae bacterium]
MPPLAAISGRNGAGKSQLLQLLFLHAQGNEGASIVRITPDLNRSRVAYTASYQQPENVGAISGNIFERARGWHQGTTPGPADPHRRAFERLAQRAVERFGRSLTNLSRSDFESVLEQDTYASVALTPDFSAASLAQLFYTYHAHATDLVFQGKSHPEVHAQLGPPPWLQINQLLRESGFPYELTFPTTVRQSFTLRCQDLHTGETYPLSALSSGEQALLSIVSSLYGTANHNDTCELMLLDEPDAHLHTSQLPAYVEALERITARHACRIILSTHRLDTLALLPEASIFELQNTRRGHTAITPCARAHAITSLSSNILLLVLGERVVFVEDSDDQRFHSYAFEVLKRRHEIPGKPSLVFVPSPLGTKVGGGSSRVQALVEQFRAAGLRPCVRGLIDRDTNNQSTADIFVLGRYAIENYLADPLNIFCAMLNRGTAPTVPGLPLILKGDESELRRLPVASLQAIVDTVCSIVSTHLDGRNVARSDDLVDVPMLTEVDSCTLQYPRWLLDMQGHQLLASVNAAIPSASRRELSDAFERLQILPAELADIYRALQLAP